MAAEPVVRGGSDGRDSIFCSCLEWVTVFRIPVTNLPVRKGPIKQLLVLSRRFLI